MNIYISYPLCQYEFVKELANVLTKRGFTVSYDKNGNNINNKDNTWEYVTADKIANADAIIVVYSNIDENSTNDGYPESVRRGQSFEDEFIYSPFLSSLKKRQLIIPIVFGQKIKVPSDHRGVQVINAKSNTPIDEIEQKVHLALLAFTMQVNQEKAAKNTLQNGISAHIENVVLKGLKKQELRQKCYAGVLYALSAVVLLFPIVAAIVFFIKTDFTAVDIGKVAVVGVIFLFVAALIISFSKFLFTLAKSFMVEAIRCSDRFHAISFGKFYIDAFDEKVTREEVMKIFSTWNIDNGATIFRNQSGDDYDPRLNELFGLLKKSDK